MKTEFDIWDLTEAMKRIRLSKDQETVLANLELIEEEWVKFNAYLIGLREFKKRTPQ